MFGYLDPGTGSIVLQVIVGGFAGIAVFLKMFGRKLMFWKKDEPTSDTDTTVDADAGDVHDEAAAAKQAQKVEAEPAAEATS